MYKENAVIRLRTFFLYMIAHRTEFTELRYIQALELPSRRVVLCKKAVLLRRKMFFLYIIAQCTEIHEAKIYAIFIDYEQADTTNDYILRLSMPCNNRSSVHS